MSDLTPHAHRQEVRLRMTKDDQARLAVVAARLGYRPRQLQALLITAAWHRLTGDVQAGRVSADELRALAALFGVEGTVPDDLDTLEAGPYAPDAIDAVTRDKGDC